VELAEQTAVEAFESAEERSSPLQVVELVEPSLDRIDSIRPERWALLDKTALASLEHTCRVLVVVMVQPWQSL
jgi:hypothetical protein